MSLLRKTEGETSQKKDSEDILALTFFPGKNNHPVKMILKISSTKKKWSERLNVIMEAKGPMKA